MMHKSPPARRCSLCAFAVVLLLVAAWPAPPAMAHEGHAALPTKGSQVDLAEGTVILSPEAHANLGVETAEVTLREPKETVLAYASLVVPWSQHAMASSRLGGRIASLKVKPGQEVKAGQVLAEIESLELQTLQAEFISARNAARLSAKTLKQAETLGAESVIARRDLYESRTTHHENVDAETIARNKLLIAGLSQEEVDSLAGDSPGDIAAFPVRSPISGTIIHADLVAGKVIEPSEHLFEIVDLSKMWVKIGVLERDVNRIEVGQKVRLRLTSQPDRVFETTVQVKVPYLDPETHLSVVWADLENPPGEEPVFLPGFHGQAEIIVSPPKKALAVPATALLGDGAERYVLVEEAASKRSFEYRKRDVVVSLRNSEFAYLSAGDVFAGDRVVTTGGHELAAYFFPGALRLGREAAENIGLRVETVRPRPLETIIELDGIVDLPPDNRATVSTQLPGVLQKIVAERGQAVEAGEVVAEIAGLEIQNLQLQFLKAHLRAELLQALLKSRRQLAAEQNLAAQQLWQTESQYNSAINDRETARRKLQAIGLSDQDLRIVLSEKQVLDSVPVRAPISGKLVRFDRTLGQSLAAQEPLFEINDLSTVWVEAYLPEREAAQVRIGQRARVRLVAQPDAVFEGTVVRSSRTLGVESRTLSAWVELKHASGRHVQRNMLANIALPTGRTTPSLAVPLDAIVRESVRSYVFVQQSDGRFERRLVQTGLADDRFVQVLSGLKAGETTAIHGAAELQTSYASVR